MLIGFHVNRLYDIDWTNSTFRADLYWWIRYPQPTDPELKDKVEALEFVNGEAIGSETRVQERKVLTESKQVFVSYRTIARFHFDADFRKFPFDRQRFPIVVEHETLPVSDLVLKDDEASYSRSGVPAHLRGVAQSVRVPDLIVRSVTREFSEHEYQTDFGDPGAPPATGFSRVTLSIGVEREFMPFLVKIIVPLLIIVLLAYLVFFVPAQELGTAAGLTVTSVLACIAVQFTLSDSMPNVGYLITSDRIFHLCYLLIMLAMVETVVTFHLEKRGRLGLSKRIERLARVLFPVTLVAGLALIAASGMAR